MMETNGELFTADSGLRTPKEDEGENQSYW